MTSVITEQSAENMAYVRRLLHRKQPGFSATLELAVVLAALELTPDIRLTAPRVTHKHA